MWLETWLLWLAALALGLSAVNGVYLLRLGLWARRRARRVGALALAAVCGGLALEAWLFLYLGMPGGASSGELAAVGLVRGWLAASSGVVSVLVLRSAWRR